MVFVKVFQFINTMEGGISITDRTKDAIELHVNGKIFSDINCEDFLMRSHTKLNGDVLNLAEDKEYGVVFDDEYPENDSYLIFASCEEEAMKLFWNHFKVY